MVQKSERRWKFLDRQLKSISEGKTFVIDEWNVRTPWRVNPKVFFCYEMATRAFLGDPNYVLAEVEVRGEGESSKGDISDGGFEPISITRRTLEKENISAADAVIAIERLEKRDINFDDGKEVWSEMRVIGISNFLRKDFIRLSIIAADSCLTNFERLFPNDHRPRQCLELAKMLLENPEKKNSNRTESLAETMRNWLSVDREIPVAARLSAGSAVAAALCAATTELDAYNMAPAYACLAASNAVEVNKHAGHGLTVSKIEIVLENLKQGNDQ